jgi:hypothetical protein
LEKKLEIVCSNRWAMDSSTKPDTYRGIGYVKRIVNRMGSEDLVVEIRIGLFQRSKTEMLIDESGRAWRD